MIKTYYQLEMKQLSPLRIGVGSDGITDSDILTDKRGFPFVPGSSIAGALRDRIDTKYEDIVFGFINGSAIQESRILVSDAVLYSDVQGSDVEVLARDGVGLDDWGMTISGSKYDFQVAECNCPFYCILETDGLDEDANGALEKVLAEIVKDGIQLGARTTRGYGDFEVAIKKMVFRFPEDVDKWIVFNPFSSNAFVDAESVNGISDVKNETRIRICFSVNDSINIRVKTTDYEVQDDGTKPDSVMLTNIKGHPIVPGTTWAGVFRHHMRDLVRDCHMDDEKSALLNVDRLFGMMPGKQDHTRSSIVFSESEIINGKDVTITRNALDRFTMAPRNSALYTVRCVQGGTGVLNMSINNKMLNGISRNMLEIAIMDLDLGILAIGGEKGVGRGRVSIDRIYINGEEYTTELKEHRLTIPEVR